MTMLKHFEKWASNYSLKNFFKKYGPFLWTTTEPQRGDSLLFTTKSPGSAGD